MNKKFYISLLIVLLTLLTACSAENANSSAEGNSGEKKKEVTFLSNFPSETLDPHLNYTAVRAGITETLVRVNQDQELEGWLAESWDTSDGGQTWTFQIRKNVTFQNGKKVDAEAVKASLERNIQVSEAMKTALKIKSMEADGQTLAITTEQKLPQFPSELVHPNTAIVDSTLENMEQEPIGTGPFKVVSFEPNSKLDLERYGEYWDGEVKLDRATMTFNEDANARTTALQSGDADIVYRPAIESLEVLKSDQSIKTNVVSSLRTHLLMYNSGKETFKDPNVRKAFDALIDRQAVANEIMAGQATVAQGPFLADSPFSPDYEKKQFSIEKAKKYLEEAGYEKKEGKMVKNGKQLTLKLMTYSYRPELPLISQVLQSNAKELGIAIEIQQVENIDEYLAEKTDWDLATYSLITAPRGDASYFLNSAYMAGGAINPGQIHNDELAKLIEELNQTSDKERRNEVSKEAIQIIDQEKLHSFLVHPNNFVAYKDHVLNWQTSKSEYYALTKDLDVRTK
ncbi:nickel ABC transporter substrate-binding protein [Cytobacillus oceanisediminis]|uniref:nickel ABC transporter substrate-binding protein n=1 Tax=Cytobacillus oceanisediminis TaxID=665099 RepID=UPI001FB1FEA5|nr:nickel ABC transporter substrate-binding protein [Cytobacillus oceanisediminis]UOE57371.1 ABC transporter substrate-binding protein [Cytobacillus oceanisediminis]